MRSNPQRDYDIKLFIIIHNKLTTVYLQEEFTEETERGLITKLYKLHLPFRFGVLVHIERRHLLFAIIIISALQLVNAYSPSFIQLPVGSLPRGIVINPSTNVGYVADYGNGNVTFVNLGSRSIINEVNAGSGIEGIALSPDNAYVYVTNYNGSSISAINTNTYAVTKIPITNSTPYGIAITPNGEYAYVTSPGIPVNGIQPNSTVYVVSLQTDKPVAEIKVGRGAQGIAISPNGRFAYVANYDDSSVSIINTTTNKVISVIAVGYGVDNIAISPNGDYVYTSNYNLPLELYLGRQFNGSSSIIDGRTNKFVKTVIAGEGPDAVAVSPTGAYAYVTNAGDGTISIINTTTNNVTGTIVAGGFAKSFFDGIAISSNGNYAYLADPYNNTLEIIDLRLVAVEPPKFSVIPVVSTPQSLNSTPSAPSQSSGSGKSSSGTAPTTPTVSQQAGSSPNYTIIYAMMGVIIILLVLVIALLMRRSGK
jgi:YVTN family beta-propeller protein